MSRPTWLRVGGYAVVILPFVVAVVRAIARDWYPIGDAAQLYIRATDVLTADHPWIGSGSSASTSLGFQVNNAGPAYYDAIAPFARTLPPGWGASIGVASVNVASLVLAGLAARRIGGAAYEAWVLAVGAVLAWTLGSELLIDMFQAHALLFPFLATCVLLTGVMLGHRWVWPWLAVTVSLILQTHLSYAYVLPMLCVTALVVALADGDRPRWPEVRTTTWVTTGVLALMWFQPVAEQLFGPGEGNLSRLARASRGTDVALGWGNALRLTAAFVALPPWAGRQGFRSTIEPSGITADGVELAGMPPTWLAVAGLLACGALLALARGWAARRELAALRALATLALAGIPIAVIAFSRLTVTGLGFAPHHTRWLVVVALLTAAALAWTAAEALRTRVPRQFPAWTAAAVVAVLASLANLPAYAQPHGPTADADALPALRQVFGGLDAAPFDDPVFFDLTNERLYAPHTSALQLHLRDRGIEFRYEPEFLVRQLGERRRATGDEPTTLTQYHAWEAYAPPAACVTIQATGQSPADRAADQARADALVDEVARAAAAGALALSVPADAGQADRDVAAAIDGGDAAALAEATLDGRLRAWIGAGWAQLDDPDAAALLAADGEHLTAWLERWFAVTLSGPGACR